MGSDGVSLIGQFFSFWNFLCTKELSRNSKKPKIFAFWNLPFWSRYTLQVSKPVASLLNGLFHGVWFSGQRLRRHYSICLQNTYITSVDYWTSMYQHRNQTEAYMKIEWSGNRPLHTSGKLSMGIRSVLYNYQILLNTTAGSSTQFLLGWTKGSTDTLMDCHSCYS